MAKATWDITFKNRQAVTRYAVSVMAKSRRDAENKAVQKVNLLVETDLHVQFLLGGQMSHDDIVSYSKSGNARSGNHPQGFGKARAFRRRVRQEVGPNADWHQRLEIKQRLNRQNTTIFLEPSTRTPERVFGFQRFRFETD